MKYTKEEMEHMLEYAKKWYPKGTRFRSTFDNKGNIQHSGKSYWKDAPAYGQVIQHDEGGWIFSEGKWAEIIDGSQPPPYIPLGTVINYEIY